MWRISRCLHTTLSPSSTLAISIYIFFFCCQSHILNSHLPLSESSSIVILTHTFLCSRACCRKIILIAIQDRENFSVPGCPKTSIGQVLLCRVWAKRSGMLAEGEEQSNQQIFFIYIFFFVLSPPAIHHRKRQQPRQYGWPPIRKNLRQWHPRPILRRLG